MTITQITENKKQYLDLLLLADEQESMIDRYLERGELFVLEDEGVKAVGVVTDEGDGVCELKNIAVAPGFQRQGYGRRLIGYLCIHYSGKYTRYRPQRYQHGAYDRVGTVLRHGGGVPTDKIYPVNWLL